MAWKQIILIVGIVSTIIYMLMIVTEKDREFYMMITSIQNLAKVKNKPNRRIVAIIRDANPSIMTVKSLIDQSVKINDIAIEASNPNVHKDISDFVSIHLPNTTDIRETDEDTVIVPIQNGRIYAYDFLETLLK